MCFCSGQITILTRGAVVLDDTPPSVRTETLKQLEARGIKHVVSATATHISESYVHLAGLVPDAIRGMGAWCPWMWWLTPCHSLLCVSRWTRV